MKEDSIDDPGDDDSERRYEGAPSLAVVTAVAEVADRPALDLDPLADWIDPDALDALVGSVEGGSGPTVSFEYAGFRVTVTGEWVRVERE